MKLFSLLSPKSKSGKKPSSKTNQKIKPITNNTKKVTKKQAKKSEKSNLNVYSLKPINVLYLQPEEMKSIVQRFQEVIHVAAEGGCEIKMYREQQQVLVGSQKSFFPFNKIEIRTKKNLENILAINAFEFTVIKNKKDVIVREQKNTIINDLYTECFCFHSSKTSLPVSWIGNNVFSQCAFVKIFVKTVSPSKKARILSKISITQQGQSKIEKIDSTAMVDVIRYRTHEGDGIVLNVKIIAGIQANKKKLFEEKIKLFQEWCKSKTTEFHIMPFGTKNTFLNGGPYNFVIESSTLYALLPFFSTDLYESGGIILGKNLDTGTPVKYHYPKRRSYHISLVAPTGSGKSFAIKIWLTRLMERFPDAFVFITDVENEYTKFGKKNGFNTIEIMPHTQLGLDPFSYMAGYKAAEMIADVVGADTLVKNEIIAQGAQDCTSTMTLFEKLTTYDKENKTNYAGYLKHVTAEPIISLISGKPQFGKRTVLSMRNSIKVKSASHRFVTILALEYIMEMATSLDVNIPKIVVLDEFWAAISAMDEGNAIDYVDGLIRRGRKYNVILMFATQNISDILEMKKVRAMFENTGTQIFMGQKSTEIDALKNDLKLPNTEVSQLIAASSLARRGEAMMHVGNDIIRMKFMANEDEISTFSTKSASEEEAVTA